MTFSGAQLESNGFGWAEGHELLAIANSNNNCSDCYYPFTTLTFDLHSPCHDEAITPEILSKLSRLCAPVRAFSPAAPTLAPVSLCGEATGLRGAM